MVRENAFAKINLSLNLIPKQGANNYYPVKFINAELDLHDSLVFKEIKNDIKVIWKNSEPISKEVDLIYRAATLLKKESGNDDLGCEIKVYKNIPLRSGLAGGSADAAATIRGLLKLWKLKIPEKKILAFVEKLGKDVFFCLKGGLCEISGYGEKVRKLKYSAPKLQTIIITPKTGKPSTGWMYEKLNKKQIGKNLTKLNKLKKALAAKNHTEILKNMFNDFDNLSCACFPEIEKAKSKLKELGAVTTILAGSGPSVIGFFKNKKDAVSALKKINGGYRAVSSAKIN